MRKIISGISAFILILSLALPYKVSAGGINVSARYAVLISADSGEVIFEKSSHEKASMASTTKIMTALLLAEEIEKNGNREIKITEEMTAVEGSSMGLMPNDRLYLDGIMTGMLLPSGNDAANAAALYLGGSQEKFAVMMNARADEIGMKDTNFVTPSGLDDEEHYSTAYDMALLGREAINNDIFSEVCSSNYKKVEFIEPVKTAEYSNHNKLLNVYEGCTGIKTGFTKKSGRCLVSSAERDGKRLVAVTLDAPDDWNDHIEMFDYGFSKTTLNKIDNDEEYRIPVVGGEYNFISAHETGEVSFTVYGENGAEIEKKIYLPMFLYASVKADEAIGRVVYKVNGKTIGTRYVVTSEGTAYTEKKSIWDKFFKKDTG